jgi:hypothetical protein
MKFFNFFTGKRKNNKDTVGITIEKQLDTLSKLGISPRHDLFVEWLCNDWGRETVETDPWNLILFTLGGERELDNGWEPLSNDIYSFDTECVEDDNIYADIFKKLSFYSKGDFNINNVSSEVNHENKEASVSFAYERRTYHWKLRYDDDWFDCAVISRINDLIHGNGIQKSFYTCSPDQNLFILYASDETIKELNTFVSVPFILPKSPTV